MKRKPIVIKCSCKVRDWTNLISKYQNCSTSKSRYKLYFIDDKCNNRLLYINIDNVLRIYIVQNRIFPAVTNLKTKLINQIEALLCLYVRFFFAFSWLDTTLKSMRYQYICWKNVHIINGEIFTMIAYKNSILHWTNILQFLF